MGNPIYTGQIAHRGAVFAGQHPAIVEASLWQAVQDQLKAHQAGDHTRRTAANPSLLTGLVFDRQGQRLTPTHAKKGEKRYRYYVAKATQTASGDEENRALRWPAQELEDAVLQGIQVFLRDEHRLSGLIERVGAAEVQARLQRAAVLARQLEAGGSGPRMEIVQRTVRRITVHADRLEIKLGMDQVWDRGPGADGEDGTAVIEVPVQLKRCGMAVRLVVRAPGQLLPRRVDPTLVGLIAKAHDWFERLSSSRRDSVMSIAEEEQVTGSYVTRVIQLAFLAPDLVERIRRGEHPPELNAQELLRRLPLPLAWAEQRAWLGMQD